nr:carboxypeptidase regulatory-like domain-containing protein [Sphingomonas jinjuensis]
MNFARRALRGGTALQALALLGAGVGAAGIATPAAAQDYSQINATGRILSTSGEPIAGATVTVTSNGQGFTRTVTTGSDGTYRVPSLPQGSYTFTVEAQGFDTFSDANVSLTQAGAANQFTLAPAGSATGGEVVVTAGRVAVVDFDRNTTGAVINVGDLATRVPVARDITSVVLLAPGTQLGDPAFGNVPQIAGSSVSENTYYINGLNITDFQTGIGGNTVPFDFYQTVEVKTGGVSAEFGRFTGGFVNATTKSGSNEFHGGVTFNWEPDDLRSKTRNTYLTDNDSRYSERKEFIAQLSGPIIKDHLFFYGIYNSRNVVTALGSTTAVSAGDLTRGGRATVSAATLANSCFANPSTCSFSYPGPANSALNAALGVSAANPTGFPSFYSNFALAGSGYTRSTTKSPFYGGKLDAVIIDGQRLEFTYFNTESVTRNDTFGNGTFTLASGGRYNPNTNEPGRYASTNVTRTGGENYVGRYTGTFTDWFTLSGAYGRAYTAGDSASSTPNFPSIIDQRTGAANSVGNPTGNSTFQKARREFYRADADLYVKLLGNHHFRGGYDRENLQVTSNTLANGNYQLTYLNSGAAGDNRVAAPNTQYVTRRYFRNGGFFTTNGEAYYLQDNWTLLGNRLNLNVGVRNDRFTNKNADGETFFNSGDNWAPRLSASFDPVGDGRTKVFGSFNRYFLPVATNTNLRLAGPELDYTQYYVLTGLNADQTPIYGAPIAIRGGGASQCPALAIEPTAGNVANCTVNSDGTSPPFNSLVSQNLQAQSVDEYQLGFEQRIGSRIRVSAFYTQRDLRVSLEDAYIDSGVQAYCRRTQTGAVLASCLNTFTGAHQYALLNPGKDVVVALDGSSLSGQFVTLSAADIGLPKAVRKYKSMTFTFDREFDGKWSLSANYTLSANVGNIEGGVRSDNGQTDSGLTTNFDYPALTNGAYGYLPTHNRHNIKVYGSYQLFDFLNLGANLQVLSPRKYGCIGVVPTLVDGGSAGAYGAAGFYCNVVNGTVVNNANGFVTRNDATGSTLQLTPRGSQLQNDWQYNVGLDVALRIPTDSFDGTLRLSVFNLLNSKSVFDLQEVGTTPAGAPSPNYGLPLTYQTPRYFRVQFGVNF